MKEPQNVSSGTTSALGGRGDNAGVTTHAKKRPGCGKNFVQKNETRLVPGAPEIAHPNDTEKYEVQLAFVYGWFFEMWERVEGDDEKAACAARGELQTLSLNGAGQLLRLALKTKDGDAKKWAGAMLGNVYASIGKHGEKLCKTNPAYRKEKQKIGKLRTDLLFPKSPITRIVRRELKRADRYRRRLLLFKVAFNRNWEAQVRGHNRASKQKIPQKYWPFVELPEFSKKSEPRWWDLLWPLIGKKIGFLKLPPLKVRDYDTVRVKMRVSCQPETIFGEKKNRKRYHSDSQKAARDVLKSLARKRDEGVLF